MLITKRSAIGAAIVIMLSAAACNQKEADVVAGALMTAEVEAAFTKTPSPVPPSATPSPAPSATPTPEPPKVSLADPGGDCRSLVSGATSECSADVVLFEVSLSQDRQTAYFTFTFADPSDLSMVDTCIALDLDENPATGYSDEDGSGADQFFCHSGFDGGMYVDFYNPDGTFARSESGDALSTPAPIVIDDGGPDSPPLILEIPISELADGDPCFVATGHTYWYPPSGDVFVDATDRAVFETCP